jgi:hypothetical protein
LATVTSKGALQIDPKALGEGISASTLPEAFLCKGTLALVDWTLSVAPGTASVNPGGSDLIITRSKGKDPVIHSAPLDRWHSVAVAGNPGILSSPIVSVGNKQFGDCFLAVYQATTDVLTTITGTAANDGFCLAIGEAILR